ncbi:MAG: hypothetical protein ACLFVL_03925 [Candidatus Aenigmatarchaeota archaeon]
MKKEGFTSKLDELNKRFRKVKQSRFSLLVYIGTVFVASLWLIFVNPCLMNVLHPVLAILIPYKLYDENDLKKLFIVGIVSVLLIALSISAFQLGLIYDRPPRLLRSEHFQDGSVEPLYGDSSTSFNFTVNITREYLERDDVENYTVYLNLTVTTAAGVGTKDYEKYEMERIAETNHTYTYHTEVSGLDERLYGHYFSVRRNMTIEGEPDYDIHRTSRGYGPITIERSRAFRLLTFEYFFSTVAIFLFGLLILWLKRRMDRGVKESTEGLEEKEKELEDQCPECGALLGESKKCDECEWEIGAKEEPDPDELEEADQLEPLEETLKEEEGEEKEE